MESQQTELRQSLRHRTVLKEHLLLGDEVIQVCSFQKETFCLLFVWGKNMGLEKMLSLLVVSPREESALQMEALGRQAPPSHHQSLGPGAEVAVSGAATPPTQGHQEQPGLGCGSEAEHMLMPWVPSPALKSKGTIFDNSVQTH